jgi:hypothetical protein
MSEPFTLRIFVPSGDPEGVRILERMNWTGRGIVLPRDRWPEVKSRPEVAQPGVYVLTGYEVDELGSDRLVSYIGQTDSLKARIESHVAQLEWWDRAALFLSGNDGLNRAHTTWIEWELIRRATEAKRCRLENRVGPSEPVLIESEKADTRAFVREMLRIAPVMGLQIFETPRTAQAPLFTTASGAAPVRDIRDTIVVPAQRDGFEKVFLGQNSWWAIRIAGKHLANLKWIAAYQVAPIGSITHIAEIERLEPYGDSGKWKVLFRGSATELPCPIPFGDAVSGTMQGPRYTTRSVLQQATTVRDLMR